MPRFRFHDLRHGYASRLAEAGPGEQELAALLGHGSSQMVSRYAHLRPETLGRAADVLEAASETVAEVIELPKAADAEAEGGD